MVANYVNLPYPHGFLVWRGKQKGVLSDRELSSKCLIVTDDEAFGYAELGQPIQVTKDLQRPEYRDIHQTNETERKLHYPNSEQFYIYRIKSFEPFEKTRLFLDGALIESDLSQSDEIIREQIDALPKAIYLDKVAVLFDGKQFSSSLLSDEINHILKSVYGDDIKEGDLENGGLPLYQLALVKSPDYRLKKKLAKEDKQMPWEIERDNPSCEASESYAVVKEDGEVEGCHETESEAEAQLAALNIAEAESEKQVTLKEMSISQFVDFVMKQFNNRFNPDFSDNDMWVKDVFDTHLIAENDGKLFRVGYLQSGENLIFTAPEDWAEVDLVYVDKAAKHLWSKEEDSKNKPSLLEKAKQAAMWVLGVEEKTNDSPDLILPDISAPYGIAIKTVNNVPWHFTWSTNAFRDRDGEIFATDALKNFVTNNEKREDKGTFDFWHIPGTDFAKKEWQAVIGRFLIEAGPYFENEAGQAAKEFFQQNPEGHQDIAPEGWGASPEFVYLPEDRVDTVYDWLHIVKTSTLPRSIAANVYTKGSSIIMNDQQREAAKAIFGDEFVDKLEQEAVKATEDLENQGVDHKQAKEQDESESKSEAKEVDASKIVTEVVEILGKQLSVDTAPILEKLESMETSFTQLSERLTSLEKQKALKEDAELPRYVFSLAERATEAKETEVKENDEILNDKPKEKKSEFGIAQALFSQQ